MSSNIGYIYVLKSQYGYKIGKTISVPNRIYTFTIKLPFDINIVYSEKVDQYHKVETALHRMYKDKNIKGEWFSLAESDIVDIKKVCEEKAVKKNTHEKLKHIKTEIDPRAHFKIKTNLSRDEFYTVASIGRLLKYDFKFTYKEQLLGEFYHYIVDDSNFHPGRVDMNLLLQKLENGDEEYHKILWSKIWLYTYRFDG